MKTPPNKEAETLEEIAERVAREWIPEYDDNEVARGLYLDILSCLRNERERAAKIAETHSATDCDGPDCGVVIAKAIREGE